MKRLCLFLLAGWLGALACSGQAGKTAGTDLSKSDVSYAFGVSVGDSIKRLSVTIDYNSFLKGVKDVLDKGKASITSEEANAKVNAAIVGVKEQKEKAFLDENGKKPGVITTGSGLQYEIIKEGTGRKPLISDVVNVYYKGTLLDGTVFDNNQETGKPAAFGLYSVIPAWSEGLLLMPVGSIFKFYVPFKLGYGEAGYSGSVPAYATLIFEIELVSLMDRPGL